MQLYFLVLHSKQTYRGTRKLNPTALATFLSRGNATTVCSPQTLLSVVDARNRENGNDQIKPAVCPSASRVIVQNDSCPERINLTRESESISLFDSLLVDISALSGNISPDKWCDGALNCCYIICVFWSRFVFTVFFLLLPSPVRCEKVRYSAKSAKTIRLSYVSRPYKPSARTGLVIMIAYGTVPSVRGAQAEFVIYSGQKKRKISFDIFSRI